MERHYTNLNSWPSTSVFRRKAPGIAVIGRTWTNVHIDRIPHLIGEIFDDLDWRYPVIGLMISFSRNNGGKLSGTVTLTDMIKKLTEVHAVAWQHMPHLMNIYFTLNEENGMFPTIYIECDRSGLYWVALN